MSEHKGADDIGERLSVVARELEFLVQRENKRWSREYRSAERAFRTHGLISVWADEEDLKSAGVNTAPGIIMFDSSGPEFEFRGPEWEAEKLWEIKHGDGYGFVRGTTIDARNAHGRFYLHPELAAKVNAIRAKKYLDGGGTVEEAEQMEGGRRYDRNFVAAVRAEAKRRDAELIDRERNVIGERLKALDERLKALTESELTAAQASQLYASHITGMLTLNYLRTMLMGIWLFLIFTAIGSIVWSLRIGFELGLAVGLVFSLVGWGFVEWVHRNFVLEMVENLAEEFPQAAKRLKRFLRSQGNNVP